MSQYFGTYFGDSSTAGSGSSTDPGVGNVRFGATYTINDVDLVGTCVLPDVTDVALGVQYGADGIEFTGTLDTSGSAPTAAENAAAVWAYVSRTLTATADANVVQVNSIDVGGSGVEGDPWGPA